METQTGAYNWRISFRLVSDGAELLRALTCDERAALPETVLGAPVVALARRALAPEATKPADCVELTVLGAPRGDAAWDNRALRELTLPAPLARVGDYALADCTALGTLRLCGGEISWGTAAVMNCRALDTLIVPREAETSAAWFVSELSRELDVTILDGGVCAARYIFPEYLEEFVENGPAHHFDYKVYGAGAPYRRVFRGRRVSAYDFDALWPGFLAAAHDEDTALRLAWNRVRFPEGLSAEARERYAAYLSEHAADALCRVVPLCDAAETRDFLRLISCPAEALRAASALARENRNAAASALLLDELHGRGAARSAFEL